MVGDGVGDGDGGCGCGRGHSTCFTTWKFRVVTEHRVHSFGLFRLSGATGRRTSGSSSRSELPPASLISGKDYSIHLQGFLF